MKFTQKLPSIFTGIALVVSPHIVVAQERQDAPDPEQFGKAMGEVYCNAQLPGTNADRQMEEIISQYDEETQLWLAVKLQTLDPEDPYTLELFRGMMLAMINNDRCLKMMIQDGDFDLN